MFQFCQPKQLRQRHFYSPLRHWLTLLLWNPVLSHFYGILTQQKSWFLLLTNNKDRQLPRPNSERSRKYYSSALYRSQYTSKIKLQLFWQIWRQMLIVGLKWLNMEDSHCYCNFCWLNQLCQHQRHLPTLKRKITPRWPPPKGSYKSPL